MGANEERIIKITSNMAHISVVSPVYMAENILPELVERITQSLQQITNGFEIILVEDGSPDQSWAVIEQLARKYPFVKGIKLSRNFGQHYAITAGLNYCKGEWIVVMDCDLQDRPEEIINLYNKATEGYMIVFAKRINRKDKWLKRLFSRLFYWVLSYLTDTKQDPSIANFGIFHHKVISSILSMNDFHRFFPTMVRWVGFRDAEIGVKHSQRHDGKSGYSIRKLLRLGLDVILSFSDKPLRLMVKFGFSISILSVIFAIYNLILYLNNIILVPGYASLIISVWFLSGLIVMVLGVVGLYVGKTFDKVKGRPTYLIQEKTF